MRACKSTTEINRPPPEQPPLTTAREDGQVVRAYLPDRKPLAARTASTVEVIVNNIVWRPYRAVGV